MKNYKRLGDYIRLVDERNTDLAVTQLVGLTINKEFIPSVANTIGSDMANYKIIRKNQFACSLMQVRRDKKIPIALFHQDEPAIISQAYPVFKIIDTNVLLPEYLMMWFSRSEFDREACFYAVGGVRGSLEWDDFCDFTLPIPNIDKQQALIDEYHAIERRIELNEQLCEKLEETAQTLYRKYFVDDIDPENLPKGWRWGTISTLGKIKHGYAFNGENFSDDETSLVLVSPGNFKISGGFNFDKNKYFVGSYTKNFVLQENDLIINMTDLSKNGDILGNTAIIPKIKFKTLLHNQRVGKFEMFDKAYIFYLFYVTNKKEFKHYILGTATGTTVRHTSPDRIGEFMMLIPEKEVIETFNASVKPIIQLINDTPSKNYKLKQLQSLILANMGKEILIKFKYYGKKN